MPLRHRMPGMADRVEVARALAGALTGAGPRHQAGRDAQPAAVSRRGVISTESLAVLSHAVPSWTVT